MPEINETEKREQHERDLRAIAHLVNRIRPDWHVPGTMAVLRDCPTDKLADTALAAILCARDRRDQDKPAVIALDGSHWRVGKQDEPVRAKTLADPIPQTARCGVCHRDQPGHDRINAIVAEDARHEWITERDLRLRRKAASRPRQEPTQ